MKNRTTLRPRNSRLGAPILEYVIIAVGIGIFCVFGILMFGKSAQSQIDESSKTLAGDIDADAFSAADAQAASALSDADDAGRTGTAMDRR